MSKILKFKEIHEQAIKRKGGRATLNSLLDLPISNAQLALQGDDRFLAAMARAINQAGFNWSVIANKWPQFEEAFFGFNINKLSHLSPDVWEQYMHDKRIVRHGPKIRAVMENVYFISDEAEKHGSFAKFIANWPEQDQVGLLSYLKKHGSRLGGKTGQWFLRYAGKDCFVMNQDVILALRNAGYDIPNPPTSKRDLQIVQDVFNLWHNESGLPYTSLSRIAAFSVGINYETATLQREIKKFRTPK
jgi:3-methyladenine DNA glycosylase Tag